jgi:hypothetical protein
MRERESALKFSACREYLSAGLVGSATNETAIVITAIVNLALPNVVLPRSRAPFSIFEYLQIPCLLASIGKAILASHLPLLMPFRPMLSASTHNLFTI